MILTSLRLEAAGFESATGWALKPQGACKGDLCVPLPVDEGTLDAAIVAERLGMGLVHDETHALWALGPETVGGRALATVEVPDLRLPDRNGDEFALSSLRGRKVLLLAWASW